MTPSLYELVLEQGGEPVIPPRSHRKYQHRYDRIAYKQRWGIEGFFAKLKQWRRIATRYDKLAANFLGFVKLASIMLWLYSSGVGRLYAEDLIVKIEGAAGTMIVSA